MLHRPLAHNGLLHVRKRHVPGIGTHILDLLEANAGHEPGRLPRFVDLAVQLVDLLKRKALGFVYHTPHEENADETTSSPNEEDLRLQVDTLGGGRARVL